MLAENIKYLKKNYLTLFETLKKWERTTNSSQKVTVETTKSNALTIKFMDNNNGLYLHSKYNPIQEAKTIIDQIETTEKIDENVYVIFYGLGLGYHVDEFVQRYPNTVFSIYEPSIEVLDLFFKNKDVIKKWSKLDLLECSQENDTYDAIIIRSILDYKKNLVIIPLPVYEKIFHSEYQNFLKYFQEKVMENRTGIATTYSHKKRWIFNGVKNLKKILETPNITMNQYSEFKNKTAILVAAGPSLNFEIENLKVIKEEKDALIFSVGSAINTLIKNELYPDVICTFDPSVKNQQVFRKLNEKCIKDIPMIFGSSIGYEVLEQYLGPMYHIIINRDLISQYLLKYQNKEPLKVLKDAPTIATLTIELLNVLGFTTIILVGQNLAFLEKENYADGIDYHAKQNELDDQLLLEIKDVNGKPIKTTRGYYSMKKTMEMYIDYFDAKVVNTTKGGAHIEGTIYRPLEEVLPELLDKGKNEENYISSIIRKEQCYDLHYMHQQINKILKSYEQYYSLLKRLEQHIEKLTKLVINKNISQASLMHKKLDAYFNDLENHLFFMLVAKPMNISEFLILTREIKLILDEKSTIKKLDVLLPKMRNFIRILFEDKKINDEIIKELIEIEQICLCEQNNSLT
ncbi:MAG: 6-hydroxymethylpterin diphosphokinase MptE-like protein [Acetobacterium sp.]|uniref:motility associated factor glycosyltransferase family protein n=1 Tax=Acetobacterium sp. TaxID=1872094 RepID=UPI003242D6F0